MTNETVPEDLGTVFILLLPDLVGPSHYGSRNKVKDFKDMLQYQCIKANGCDVIITNSPQPELSE